MTVYIVVGVIVWLLAVVLVAGAVGFCSRFDDRPNPRRLG